MAQSGLARLTGGQKVAGSNPVAPIFLLKARTSRPQASFLRPVGFEMGQIPVLENRSSISHILLYYWFGKKFFNHRWTQINTDKHK